MAPWWLSWIGIPPGPRFRRYARCLAQPPCPGGRQGLSGYLLRRGPGGPWETLDSTLSIADENRIKSGAQIVLVGAFGALESGHMSADWRALIQRLQRRSHPLHLLPLCPLHDPLVTQSPLDPRQVDPALWNSPAA